MAVFDVRSYCGHYYNQVREFFKNHPDEVHKREDSIIWDFVQFKYPDIPNDVINELKKIDMPRVRRAVQDLRNYHYPKTQSFWERQKLAKEYGGRHRPITQQERFENGKKRLKEVMKEMNHEVV